MVVHIQRYHPGWYDQLPLNQRQALPTVIMRLMENATAFF
jgi:hypothetical protein